MRKFSLASVMSLCGVAFFMGALVFATHAWTAPMIESRLAASSGMGNLAVLPEADGFVEDTVEYGGEIFAFSRATNDAGFVFSVVGAGFGGPVEMLVGVDLTGEIVGVLVTEHNETAGLGSPVAEEPFLSQFTGNIQNGFAVGDEIDVLSGATVSTEAIADTVNKAANLFIQVTGGAE